MDVSQPVLGLPLTLIARCRLIVTRTAYFGRTYLDPINRPGLKDAISFYVQLCSVAFVLLVIADQFSYYGESEVRWIAKLSIQLVVGFPIVYVVLRVFSKEVSRSGVLEAMLYVDGCYIVAESTMRATLAYFDHYLQHNALPVEEDIYGNAFEACVANNSTLYWLIRGNLQFLLNQEHHYHNQMLGWLMSPDNNWRYLIAVPFTILFGKLIQARYGMPWLKGTVSALTVFAIVNWSFFASEDLITNKLAQAANCTDTAIGKVTKQYKPEVLARQLKLQLSNEIGLPIYLQATDFIVVNQIPNNDQILRTALMQWVQWLPLKARYCHEGSTFRLARAINYNLVWTVVAEPNNVLLTDRVTPNDCATR